MMHSYSKILSDLININRSGGVKLGLKNCLEIDKLLDFPSRSFPSVHIAGTNGKGSVSTKIAAAYEADGMKVGLYTSPHIACFRERIRINGKMISEEQVQTHLSRLFNLCEKYDIKATFFELTTMLAFLHFSSEKVDRAILETGLGGRLDATNIVTPILSVITSINLDHTEILGSTIESITKEKAGIIKPGVRIVIGPTVDKIIIDPLARKNGSRCIEVSGVYQDYHEENRAIAKAALEELKLPLQAIEKGIEALPPCRMETFSKSDLIKKGLHHPLPKTVILDAAHNPDGLKHLKQAIDCRYGQIPLRFILGLSSNKDVQGCLSVIGKKAAGYHLVEGCNERAEPKKQLANHLADLGVSPSKIACEFSIESAITNAFQFAEEKNEIVIVCGTFFIMKEARKALGIREPQDPEDMNEGFFLTK